MEDNKNIFGLDLKVDQDYISEAVKQSVMLGISESLNGKNEIASQIVSMVLTTMVDENGKISSYSRDNKQTLLEYYVRNIITEITKEELQNIIEEKREVIAECMRKELEKKSTLKRFVDKFIDNVYDSVNNSWCPRINIEFDDKRKDY